MWGARPAATLGSTMIVMVMVAPRGRPKQHRADVGFQDIKGGTVGVGGRQEHLRWDDRGTGDSERASGRVRQKQMGGAGTEREGQKVKDRGSLDSDFWQHAPPGR